MHLAPQKDRRVLKGKCLPMAQTLRLPLTQTSAGPLYVIGQLVKKHTPSAATLKAIYRTGCRERSTTG